jgi:hypothetical protein
MEEFDRLADRCKQQLRLRHLGFWVGGAEQRGTGGLAPLQMPCQEYRARETEGSVAYRTIGSELSAIFTESSPSQN